MGVIQPLLETTPLLIVSVRKVDFVRLHDQVRSLLPLAKLSSGRGEE